MKSLCNWVSLCTKIVVARLQSSGLRLKNWNIVSIKTTHATKILWIALSWIGAIHKVRTLKVWFNSCSVLSCLFWYVNFLIVFFLSGFFILAHSRFTGQQGKGDAIYLTPPYHFHPLYRHSDINWAIIADSSPLDIASSRTRTGNVWFPSTSRFL